MQTLNNFISEKLKITKNTKIIDDKYVLSYNEFIDKLFSDFKYLGKLNLPYIIIDEINDCLIMKLADIYHQLPSKVEKNIQLYNLNEKPINSFTEEETEFFLFLMSSTYPSHKIPDRKPIWHNDQYKINIWIDNGFKTDYYGIIIEFKKTKFMFYFLI